MEQYVFIILSILLAFFAGIWLSFIVIKRNEDRLLRGMGKRKDGYNPLDSYLKGLILLVKGDLAGATKVFTQVASNDPENLDLYFIIASLSRKSGALNKALKIHENIIVREPNNKKMVVNALIEMGMDYRQAGLLEKSRDVLLQALEVDNKNEEAHRQLVGVLEEMDLIDEACNYAGKLQKITGEDIKTWVAYLYTKQGRHFTEDKKIKEAKRAFSKAISTDIDFLEATFELGKLWLLEGNKKKGFPLFQSLLKSPHFPTIVVFDTVYQYVKEGKWSSAQLQEFLISVEHEMQSEPAYQYFLILSQILSGQKDRIVKQLVDFSQENPSFLECFPILNRLLDESEIESQSRQLLRLLLQVNQHMFKRSYTCEHCGYTDTIYNSRCVKCRRFNTINSSW